MNDLYIIHIYNTLLTYDLPIFQGKSTLNFNGLIILLFFRPDTYDRALVHSIESIIIDWTHQIRDVLKRDSAQPLLEGLNPNPFVELEFWKAKATNLECIYDQVSRKDHISKCIYSVDIMMRSHIRY